MKTRIVFVLVAAVWFILFSPACDSRPLKTEKPNTYPHPKDLKTDVAWIVLEWNGKPKYGGYGSGFLVDKYSGSFYTNKHVSDMFDSLGRGSQKVFFNGKVYNLAVVKVPALRDAAIVQIKDSFDFSEFPDSAPIAEEKVKKGDKVLIEGFHPHPYFVRESNKAEGGYNEKLVSIFKEYYNMGTRNLEKEVEVVFESFTGVVVETDASVFLNSPSGSGGITNRAREMTNTYFMVKTDKDHKFSFGGLSGTAVKNTRGEIVGILTVEKTDFKELEKDENAGIKVVEIVFDLVGVTPIESVVSFRDYLKK
ncbi:MAG: trypsin-like peptidase domain-containing protein [Candidatus Yanofskybacteria bacterium]|nr:trypsin-like peptidase domain-containing protein [Candidatus Yanofskybacteria bacterium]